MKALTKNGSYIDIHSLTDKRDCYTSVSLSKDMDYSNIERIEFDFWGNIAKTDDKGYMVIPRGEGCNDYTLCFFEKHKDEFEREITQSNMPIFGVKSQKHTFLAIVSGMSYDYTLKVEQKNGSFRIYPIFEIYGEQPYEDIKVEFFELTGRDADYSGMARRYRKYRLDKGELVSLEEKIKNSKETEYSADSIMVRIRCGWKPAPAQILHQTRENEPPMFVACDFDRVSDILDEFKSQGIDKAEFCLVGWNVKGHDGRWPEAFPVCEELGGEEKLKTVIEKAENMGYHITCHTNSTDQYEIADIFDTENTRRDRFGNPVINPYIWSGGQMYDLCPQIGYQQATKILPEVAKLGFRGTHYIDVLGVVHPRRCYHPDHYVNSKQSVEYAKKLCDYTRELFGGMSTEGAYDFVAPYIDYGLYISFSNENDGLCDRPIPFWQIVYHGYVMSNPYTSTVNCTFKDKRSVLKLIEYGGRPSFYFYSKFTNNGYDWMGTEDAVCDTDEHLRQSVSKIKEGYELYRELQPIKTAFMENHREITENVFEITYSNGVVITVDYNKFSYKISTLHPV